MAPLPLIAFMPRTETTLPFTFPYIILPDNVSTGWNVQTSSDRCVNFKHHSIPSAE